MGFLWRGEDMTLRQANETLDLLVSGCCQVHRLSGTVIVQETVKHLRQKLVVQAGSCSPRSILGTLKEMTIAVYAA